MLKRKVIDDVEKKNLYLDFPYAQIDYNGTLTTPINVPVQGVDVDARIGRSITCAGIDFRYKVCANTNAPVNVGNAIRVIVVLDHDASITQAQDLLYDGVPGFTIGTTRAPLSFYNRNNRAQFSILYDKLHEFDYQTGNLQQYEKVVLKTKHKTTFVDNSAVVSKNALRVFMISDSIAATRPCIEWVMTYYYTDE